VRSSHENGAKISPASVLVSSFTVAAVMTFGSIGATVAQEAGGGAAPGVYERFAFDAADTDGDGFVSEAELARDAAAGFSGLDQDRSGTLTPDELGPHDPAMFARVDANGDGVLSFSEVMDHKVRAFERGDANGDGGLSFDEMVQSVRTELGVQQ
jgi:Ca2+-binding EF-hand superfamily protein